uniref:Kazal-like domain-containing protein n=1 Tax=Ciona savignyi TaxID=51511 RepID=H2YPN1_CIOSA
MMQWRDLRPACCGIVNFSFPLSDQPVLGTWTIFVEMQQHSYNTTFEIQTYVASPPPVSNFKETEGDLFHPATVFAVLPKFAVAINPPPFFRSDCERISVHANYVFGKPVVGNLTVNMTVFGIGYSRTAYLDQGNSVIRELQINGESEITVCLRDLLPSDLSPHFRGALAISAKVTTDDSTTIAAYDDTTPISRQHIEIQFTSDTRSHFKPGIPFKGKRSYRMGLRIINYASSVFSPLILATNLDKSPAAAATILLIVSVNRAQFFREEIASHSDGIVSFTIPGLPTSSKLVWIEARVIAYNGNQVGRHYQSIYKNIFGWKSPSNCHILAQGPGSHLTVGGKAKVLVKSTCPCNFTLFYEILARGNIVQIGQKVVTPENSAIQSRQKRSPPSIASFNDALRPLPITSTEIVENEICHTSLVIDVTSNMAPLSRMLVYYVNDIGEAVADSIHVPVKPKLDNEVSVHASNHETKPGSDVTVSVTSDPGSCVCLALVDKSVHLMKPGYMLTSERLFEEMFEYDLGNLPHEQEVEWWRISRSRRSAHMWWDYQPSRDAEYAFLESGMVVMTDVIILNSHTRLLPQLIKRTMTGALRTQEIPRHDAPTNRLPKRRRTFFPETWVWQCFNVSSRSENFTFTVPDSITTWQADAVSLNPTTGIGISRPKNIRSFKPFFIDFTIPYSVVRGEQVRIPLTVYNYLDVCTEVSISVIIPPGVSFPRRNRNGMSRRLCINAQSTQSTDVLLQFDYLGSKNISVGNVLTYITAGADAMVGASSCCTDGNGPLRIVDNDLITRHVLVQAEGIKREYTNSIYFCPNERINISTNGSHTFQFVRLPTNMTSFNFLVRASNNVHVALSPEEGITNDSYEIVLGGAQNQRSWITRNSEHLVTAATDPIVSSTEFREFWVTLKGGNVWVGTGNKESSESMFMQWRNPTQGAPVAYAGFATSAGATGDFRLWNKESSGGSIEEDIYLSIPGNKVAKSERAVISMIGDVMGPTLNNLNNLLRLPYGCGEQNLANFAPNVYVLKYLKQTKQLKGDVNEQAIHLLQTGYQRQLTYKRNDGSYSPFGDRDASGSMWLTSFVLKSFAQAREFIYIDPNELHEAKEWIISWQDRNGSFPAVGKIWNKDIQAGVDSDVALTAYAAIALLEAGLELEDEILAATRAREYLEPRVYEDTDPYTSALTAYALTLLDSDYAAKAQQRLARQAINDGGVMYWSLNEEMYEDSSNEFAFGDSMKQTIVSAEVEMTAYALLTYIKLQNLTAALPIDTCVALQSLSEYAIFSFIGGVDLQVDIASSNMDYSKRFVLDNENGKVLQQADIPSLPATIFVNAFGDGCALLQIDVTYNIPEPTPNSAFDIKVHTRPLSTYNHQPRRQGTLCLFKNHYNTQPAIILFLSFEGENSANKRYQMEACVRWANHGSSNMAVLEFNLFTGFVPDLESLQQVLETNTVNLKRYEVSGRKIIFYFDEIYSTCRTCVRFVAIRRFETGKVKPQPVVIYDYYEPAFQSEVMYSPSATLMENLCEENTLNCTAGLEKEESADNCRNNPLGCGDMYNECHCSHKCSFKGPPVCASNHVIYMNRCRMESAACELGSTLTIEDDAFCE